jgi:signal transduction histidine kinase
VVTVSPAPTVRVSTQNTAAAEAVQLIVRDDGCGMSPEVLEHMFEPFFTTRHEQGGVGVGLGLAVARSIVIAHNGTIKADSSPGQGSAVTIIFPVEGRHHVIN